MDIADFAKLIEIAQEENFETDDLVCLQGQKNPYVRLVIEGKFNAMRDHIKTYSLTEGNFVTESGLHAGLLLDGTIETSCTIVSQKKSKCLKWNRTELVNLLKSETSLWRAFKAILTWDIVRKLKAQRYAITDHEIENAELWTIKRKEQTEDRYAAIVQNMFSSQRSQEALKKRTKELDHYRTIHLIDDEHHELALSRIGWTLEEYKAGKKLKRGMTDLA
jgi:CRP-like cAMP-binding protein